MGNCRSIPEVEANALADLKLSNTARAASFDGGRQQQHRRQQQQEERRNSLQRHGSAELRLAILQKVNGLQQQLALANASPLLRLPEAAELLAAQLEADLVAIWVVPKAEPSTSVLMASHGQGVAALRRSIVVRALAEGPEEAGVSVGAPCSLNIPDATSAGAALEPAALWQGPAALRSFVQVPIGTAANPLGVLLLAKSRPNFFSGPWWQVQLRLAATGLVPHARQGSVQRVADLLRRMDAAGDAFEMIGTLLRGAADFVQQSCMLRANARLALLQPRGCPDALLFEAAPPAPQQQQQQQQQQYGAARSDASATDLSRTGDQDGGGGGGDAAARVVASALRLSNTLLGAAVAQRQARFVSDVSVYMRCCPRPARDIFTRAGRVVSSVVVVPLVAGEAAALGGLYFALEAPCEFVSLQDTLLGFIHSVAPLLHNRLAGRAEALAAAVQQAQRRPQGFPSLQPASAGDAAGDYGRTSSFTSSSGSGSHQGTNAMSLAPSSLAPSTLTAPSAQPSLASSGRLTALGCGARLNTEAMLQLLQRDLRSKHGHHAPDAPRSAEVSVGECLGRARAGGGALFRGAWHRVPVALKITRSRDDEAAAMQDAVEMAVLSSVQHPNIVQVYACLTDMVKTTDVLPGGRSASFTGGVRAHYRRLRPEEDPGDAATHNIIVMESCDRGTLRDAVDAGLLHKRLPNGAIGVKLAPAAELLLDLAYALQHLHAMQLVHGDVRMENVLLKTDPARPLGATPKLSEFGLTRIMGGDDAAPAPPAAPDAAHAAPELFSRGAKITPAVDAYAFGVLMWELYTSKRAFAGQARDDVIRRVTVRGSRPRFPSSTPPHFADLARACWAADPGERPNFTQIAEALDRLVAQLSGRPV